MRICIIALWNFKIKFVYLWESAIIFLDNEEVFSFFFNTFSSLLKLLMNKDIFFSPQNIF